MAVKFSNNAATTLAANVSTSDTSISVSDGSVFPSISGGHYTYATLEDISTNREIVKVTAISTNTLTVVRGQDGTSARAFSSGDKCELRITAALLNDVASQADTDTNTTYSASSGITLTGTTFSLTDKSDYDTAFGWGNHASAGYLTSQTSHADVVVDGDFASSGLMKRGSAAGSYSIVTDNSGNWNTAYGWGNHASAGYLTSHQSLSGYATETYVGTQVSNLVDSSPATLNTLNELAAALGDDPNFATTVSTSIGTKLPLAGGTLTGGLLGTTGSFSGSVTSTGLVVNGSGGRQYINSGHLRLSDDYNLEWGGGTNYIRGSNASNYVKIATNSSDALTIDSSQNATFSGSVTANSFTVDTGTVSASPSARFRRNHGGQAYQQLSGLSFYWNTSNGGHDNTIVYGASANSSLKFTQATGSAFNDTLTINSSGNATFSGSVTADSLTVDTITIDTGTLSSTASNFIFDAAGEIHLDSSDGVYRLRQDGGDIGMLQLSNNDLIVRSMVADKDILFKGFDGSSLITALTLDMSAAGAATFNAGVTAPLLTTNDIKATGSGGISIQTDEGTKRLEISDAGNATFSGSVTAGAISGTSLSIDSLSMNGSSIGSSGNLTLDVAGDINLDADGGDIKLKDGGVEFGAIYTNGTHLFIQSMVNSGDLYLSGKDSSGNGVNALTLDMSAAGAATFNAGVTASTSMLVGDGEAYGFGDNSYRIEGKDDGTNARIGFVTGGSESMRIDSDGATIKSGKELRVKRPDNARDIRLFCDNSYGTLETTDDPIRIKSANAIRFDTGGNDQRMLIDTSGNVGIGNITNPSAKLHLYTSGSEAINLGIQNSQRYWKIETASEKLNIADVSAGGLIRMAFDTSGRVGIGTSSPQALIDLTVPQAKTATGGATFAQLGKTNESSNYASLQCEVKGGSSAADRQWSFQTIEQGVANAGSIVLQPDGGNVGIGETVPIGKLHVKTADSGATVDASADEFVIEGSGNAGMSILTGALSTGSIYFGDSGTNWDGYIAYSQNSRSMTFGTAAGGGSMTLNSSGNVGIAKTSLATWSSGYKALQVGGRGFVGAHTGSDLYVGQNASFNGGWKYEASVAASMTQHSGGKITQFVAPAGTAGNAISWNTAIDIDPNGNVGIGGSSATARLEVIGAFAYASGANSLATTVSKASARIRGSSDASTSLFFGSLTNDAEQYIQSSNGAGSAADDLVLNPYGGNVGIGTSNPVAQFAVGGSGRRVEISGVDGVIRGFDRTASWAALDFEAASYTFDCGGSLKMKIRSDGYVDIAGASDLRLTLGSQGTAGNNDSNWIRGNGNALSFNSAAGDYIWEVGGSPKMTLTSGGNLGVGNNSPSSNHANANNLVVGDGTSGGIANYVGTGTGWYAFSRANANNSDAFDGGISYDGNRNLMFHTNAGSERLRIDGQGLIKFGGNLYGQLQQDGNSVLFRSNYSGSEVHLMTHDGSEDIHLDPSGYIKFETAGSEAMRIDSSSNVLINCTLAEAYPGATFSKVGGTGTTLCSNTISSGHEFQTFRYYNGQNGAISLSGTSGVTYATSSDYRLKENVVPMTGSIDRVKALKPSRFNFIAESDRTVDGFLAHEAQEIVPECVTGTKDAMRDEEYEVTAAVYEDVITPAVEAVDAVLDEDGVVITEAVEAVAETTESVLVTEAVMGTRSVPVYQGIDQAKLVPLLAAALQEAITQIESLTDRIAALEE